MQRLCINKFTIVYSIIIVYRYPNVACFVHMAPMVVFAGFNELQLSVEMPSHILNITCTA